MPAMYAFFHLNLAFSSIEEKDRRTVIKNCYDPILRIVEQGIPLGIELTAWTLTQIAMLEPAWVQKFKELLQEGRCELIGSGHTQLIGPLVPPAVNEWNQRIGMEIYADLLGTVPKLALVNEMAFSSGLVDIYARAGYSGIIIEKENAILAGADRGLQRKDLPTHVKSASGAELPILWAESTAFQRFQRYAHDEISFGDYLEYIDRRLKLSSAAIPIYSSDAEVFDFRPGRFKEEAGVSQTAEWDRISMLFSSLPELRPLVWKRPSEVLEIEAAKSPRAEQLTTAQHPILVKKQAKYNITRWCQSGRDDLWLNTICFRLFERIARNDALKVRPELWRKLCEFWASDFRTHITENRWQKLEEDLGRFAADQNLGDIFPRVQEETAYQQISCNDPRLLTLGFDLKISDDKHRVHVSTKYLKVDFNLKRGLTVNRIGFSSHDFVAVAGTIPQGYFDDIEFSADWYTNSVVIELQKERKRLTDLTPVEPVFYLDQNNELLLQARIKRPECEIIHTYTLSSEKQMLRSRVKIRNLARPLGSVRVGHITLLPEAHGSELFFEVQNGGHENEIFHLADNCSHVNAVSAFVSSRTGLGGTSGELVFGSRERAMQVTWNPHECAAMPTMIHRQSLDGKTLCRLIFSLCELDDTLKENGTLLPFEYKIEPYEIGSW
jgi:hypothetical protein